jgi:hypothetical protein
MNIAPALPHVHFDEQGRPWIDDTNVKVIEVVLDHLAHGWNAAEMDAEIELQRERLEALRARALPSPLERRLAAHRRGA